MSLVVLFSVFLLLCALRNFQFFPGCFQYFAARKVRSVILCLIKTDENLYRILRVRLLDGSECSSSLIFYFFYFIVRLISFCCLFRITDNKNCVLPVGNTGKSGPVSSQSQCFISPEMTLAI